MNILTSAYTLDLSGVPTYTLTLYRELVKRGHEVQVYCPMDGELGPPMNAKLDLADIVRPDVILAQHNICAESMRAAFPDVPMIFSAHHPEYEGERPPSFECEWYIAINEDMVNSMVLKGVPVNKVTIVRDFIDTEIFRPTAPINDSLQNVLYVSNRKKWRTHANLKKACEIMGVNFRAVGSPYGRSRAMEVDINKADLVIGWARCLMEAMACGRPVISYDKEIGDGYFDYRTYLRSRTRNFGVTCENKFTVDELISEMQKYDPKDGAVNRGIIMREHNVVTGADEIISVICGVI